MIDLERDDYEDEEYDPEVDVLDTWLDPEDPATRPALILRRAQPSESVATSRWVAEHHYRKSCPPRFRAVLEFLSGSELIGAMLLGRPSSSGYDDRYVLEVTRIYFIDSAPRNTESHALAMMRRWVRVWMQDVKLLLSYSDPSQGHEGIIYLADGWCPLGMTTHKSGYGWRSRPNRKDDPVTPKQRWVRTP